MKQHSGIEESTFATSCPLSLSPKKWEEEMHRELLEGGDDPVYLNEGCNIATKCFVAYFFVGRERNLLTCITASLCTRHQHLKTELILCILSLQHIIKYEVPHNENTSQLLLCVCDLSGVDS